MPNHRCEWKVSWDFSKLIPSPTGAGGNPAPQVSRSMTVFPVRRLLLLLYACQRTNSGFAHFTVRFIFSGGFHQRIHFGKPVPNLPENVQDGQTHSPRLVRPQNLKSLSAHGPVTEGSSCSGAYVRIGIADLGVDQQGLRLVRSDEPQRCRATPAARRPARHAPPAPRR